MLRQQGQDCPQASPTARWPTSSRRVDYGATPTGSAAFAVTAGFGAEEVCACGTRRELDDYNAILVKALADRLAEAYAELPARGAPDATWRLRARDEEL